MADTLPEGTDHVIPGATETANAEEPRTARDKLKSDAADLRDRASAKAAEIKDQASDKARDYAEQGKTRASGALDEVARFIGDNADRVDEKLGSGYGDYVRRASDAVSGVATGLREKDVDELMEEARNLVRRSPALAIGAAAAAGFLIARLVKAGSEALDEASRAADPERASSSPKTEPGDVEADEVTKVARKTTRKPRAAD
ncbi:MAG TPA: hypothetical protein VFL92_05265 [Sphingomonas sp.]|nr:hypothetical protein [Sphingomonas sp.]